MTVATKPSLRRGGKPITKPLPTYSDLAGPHEQTKDYFEICETCWITAQIHAYSLRDLIPQTEHLQARIRKGARLIENQSPDDPLYGPWRGKLNRLRGRDEVVRAEIRMRVWPCWLGCRDVWTCLQH